MLSVPARGPLTFLGRTNFRNQRRLFGIPLPDRHAHIYVVGRTGTGKSTLLDTLIHQDIRAGHGLALLDPHGDLAERVRAAVPEERRHDLIDFRVADSTQALGFNPLERVPPAKRPLAASGVLDVFKKIWADSWGPRLEHILRNALLALLDQPEATLADIPRLLHDADFRKSASDRVANAQVRDFWLREFAAYPARFRAEAIAPIENKVGAFLTNPLLQRIVTQRRSAFDLRDVMDHGRILVVDLAKGKIGEDTAALLGALLATQLGFAGLSRAELPEEERRDFFIYLDEFPTFTTLSLAGMLSELRKYRVGLILAHQYLGQLDDVVRDAILGNVGTMIAFRLGAPDAEILAKEFAPVFSELDLINLPNHHVYLKVMAGGMVSEPFSATTVRPDDLTKV